MTDKKIVYSVTKLHYLDITKFVSTHASMYGWEHTVKEFKQGINALKSKSMLLILMSIFKDHGIHVKIFSDINTAIAYALIMSLLYTRFLCFS